MAGHAPRPASAQSQPPTLTDMPARSQSILLARHGETEWNREGRRQGHLNSPLTVKGAGQAAGLAEALAGRRIDGIFCSPLGRARETARVVGNRLDIEPVEVEDLAEVHHGEMAGLTKLEIEQRFPGALAVRSADKYEWRFPGGENYADAYVRAVRALSTVMASGAARPLLVSHEMIGRMLLRKLLNLTALASLVETHPHDLVHVVDRGTGMRSSFSVRRIS